MEEKRKEIAPVETDFYTEALKAFDAPIPQAKKEEPTPEPVAEVTEPASPEKPRRKFNPWWAVALCALVCLALVIGFGWDGADQSRGENYVYGILLEATDEYMILSHHQMFWYVELDGLENPESRYGIDTYLWVFYNGEAEETDERGCHKKITATYWKADEEDFVQKDEINFDLDGDGIKEIWSVERSKLGDMIIGIVPLKITLRATDSRGNVLHDVVFYGPSAMDSIAFNNAGGKLSIIVSRLAAYEVLEMAIVDGQLTVRQNGEAIKLIPNQAGPENPVVTEPTREPQPIYSLMFFIPGGPMDGKIQLSAGDARVLQEQLDALDWVASDDVSYPVNWGFNFYEGDQAERYSFSKGILLHNGMQAKIGTELTEKLMGLMGQEMPDQQAYCAYLSNGEMLGIIFYDSGMARLQVSDAQGNATRSYMGRFANIEDWYLLDLGEEPRHILVLKPKDYSLEYMPSVSAQTMFREQGQLEFYRKDAGGSLSVALRCSDGSWNSSSEYAVLPVQTVRSLRQKLTNCDWQTGVSYTADEVVARFTVYDGVGADLKNPEQYYVLTGGRLLPQTPPGGVDMVATMDKTLWQLLSSFFSQQGAHSAAIYAGLNQDGMEMALQLKEGGTYQIAAQIKGEEDQAFTATGFYVRMGDVLVLLGWENGPAYIHLNVENGNLKYDAVRSTPEETFSQTTAVTLFDLQVDAYRAAALHYSICDAVGGDLSYQAGFVSLSEEVASAVSLLLHTVQWEVLQDEPSGIHMGSFSFQDVSTLTGSIDVYSGMRLVYGDTYEARLTESQWATICTLMTTAGDAVNASHYASVDSVTYSLLLNEHHQFLLGIRSQDYNEYVLGACSVLQNKVIVCFGYNGEMFALRMEEGGWCLLPGYNGIETFEIPDGTVFEEPVVDILPEESTPAT